LHPPQAEKNIWIVGGGELLHDFIEHSLDSASVFHMKYKNVFFSIKICIERTSG